MLVKRLWKLPYEPPWEDKPPSDLTQLQKQQRTRAEVGHGDLWPGFERKLCPSPPVTQHKLTHLWEVQFPPP